MVSKLNWQYFDRNKSLKILNGPDWNRKHSEPCQVTLRVSTASWSSFSILTEYCNLRLIKRIALYVTQTQILVKNSRFALYTKSPYSFLFSFAFSSCHGGYAYIFFICICFCVCDRFRFTRPWATTFRLRGLCMLGTCLSVAGPRKFASSASVRIFIVRTWWQRVRVQTGPRFIALIRRSLGSGVCTTVNSKWLSHFLTQRPKLGSNPWPLACQSEALTNWAIVL